MSRCFRFSSLMAVLALIAVPFSMVSAKTVTSAKNTVRNTAKVSKAAAKPVAGKAKQVEKKAAAAKNKVKSTKDKAVAQAGKKNAGNTKAVKKASNQGNTAKTTKSRSVAKNTAVSGKRTAKTSRKQAAARQDAAKMRMATLKAGGKSIRVEVASTEAEMEKGLMYRKSLAADGGMLFDFKGSVKTCMWMKNTYIPLSVAFIGTNGKVVNIEEMKPRTTTSHCSKDWIRYALEMNAKWFSRHGIRPGSRITGLPR